MEKTKPHGFSQHSAEDSVLQGVKQKGSAFTFLKRILPTICFHKVPPQSGNGCRAWAENTSCSQVWPSKLTNVLFKLVRNVFLSFPYMFTHTQKHVHTQIYTHRVRGCCFPWGYSCSHLTHQFTPWQHQECSSYNLQSLRPHIALLIKPSSLQWESTESDKRHRVFLLPSHLHSLALSFSLGFALTGRCNRYLIYPSPAQHWGETRLQRCDFPMLILWSSRGWILDADALVEHWITLDNISLSFHPPYPRLTPFLSPPCHRKPQNHHILQPLASRTNKKKSAAPLLFFLSSVQTREFRASQAWVKCRQQDCSSPSSSRKSSSRPGKWREKQVLSKVVQHRSCEERLPCFFRTVQPSACRNREKGRPRIKNKSQNSLRRNNNKLS